VTTAPAAPPALDFAVDNCTIGRAMAILGERWTLVVLREVFNGVRRFDDMQQHAGVPRQVLTDRLARLVEHDVLRREPYRLPGERTRHEYRLTTKGFDLYPVMVALAAWGDRYLADPEGPPVEFRHAGCGARVTGELRCTDGHPVDELRHVVPHPGPGARRFVGQDQDG
jgi:DNA-binding HxlR family transcriptional regulator